jgi:hypothetical protein
MTPTPENTLCLPVTNVTDGLCPIIDVSFIESSQSDGMRNQGYTIVSAGNVTLAFSKEPTGLPI